MLRVGGMPNHVHMLVSLPATVAVATFVHDMKLSTHQFFLQNKQDFPFFDGWTRSYCALTYSQNEKDKIIEYIKNQKQHHKKRSLVDEITRLLKEFSLQSNETYLHKDWDD